MENNIVSPSGSNETVASGTTLSPTDLPEFSWPRLPGFTASWRQYFGDKSQCDLIVQDTALPKTLLATSSADGLSETQTAMATFQQSSSQPDCSNVLSDKRASEDEVNKFDTSWYVGQRMQFLRKIRNNNAPSKAFAEQKEIQVKGHSKVRDSEGLGKEKMSIVDEKQESNHDSHRIQEKGRSKLGKSSVAAEKIWDGSLQLNSSITVPAVAFFKSGEKLLDVNWSELVDVQGKVKLEAFEKYIQELPRSRNRGLMVVSLCCNESSETGNKHVKEVAKGYIKGERVGFARLSPGVDLYLCPRTNTIITILAKHGFFKGMAAIESSKSELFIGCVVWRKNHTTASTTVAKKSESKTNSQPQQLQKSTLNSIDMPNMVKSSFSSVNNAQALASAKSSIVAENNDIKDNKKMELPKQQESVLSDHNVLSLPSSKCLKRSSSTVEQRVSVLTDHNLGTCYAEPSRENMNLSLPPNTSSQKKLFNDDDDDLPEFDFTNAYALNSTGYSVHSVPISKETFNNRYVARSAASTTVGLPQHRGVIVHGLPAPLPRQMEGRHGDVPKIPFTYLGKKKNIYDDDDDMPEWLPPNLKKQKLAEGSNIILPNTCQSTNLSIKNLPFHHHSSPRPIPSFPTTPAPNPLGFSSLAVSRPFTPFNYEVPPPVPPPVPFNYVTGFTFNPVLQRPSGPLEVKSPLQPADGVWRRP